MQKSFTIQPPSMPNFVTYQGPAGKREDGFKPDANKIDIATFTEEEAKEFADLMRETFLLHWKTRKAQQAIENRGDTPRNPPTGEKQYHHNHPLG